MRTKYALLSIFSLLMLIMACSQNPTEPVVEEQPSFYIPDWEDGKSLVLSFTWIDTSGDGDVTYSGSAVSMAGILDSIWFNFPQVFDQHLTFSIIATSQAGSTSNSPVSNAQIVYEGSINAGKYTYGYEVNRRVEETSTYSIQVTPLDNIATPIKAYLRIKY